MTSGNHLAYYCLLIIFCIPHELVSITVKGTWSVLFTTLCPRPTRVLDT